MSTDIKPGDHIRAVRDTHSWNGDHFSKGSELVFFGLSPMADGDGFDWKAGPPESAPDGHFLVKPADFERVDATPAPLDPSPEVMAAVNVLRDAGIRSAEDFDRLMAELAPEHKPGTPGTALLTVGGETNQRVGVFRLTGREMVLGGTVAMVWADFDGNRYGEDEVTDFVPDEVRPTREQVEVAVYRATLDGALVTNSDWRTDAAAVHQHLTAVVEADTSIALLRGESR